MTPAPAEVERNTKNVAEPFRFPEEPIEAEPVRGFSWLGRADYRVVLPPVCVLILTVLFTVAAFPPFGVPEAAFVFAIPAGLWFLRSPSWKWVLPTLFLAGFLTWFILLFWLRHVTYGGLFLVAGILALYGMTWFAAARWLLPEIREKGWPGRLMGLAGLAGGWVLVEWGRTFVLSGFPWLPLAASQWERPFLLQVAAWTGSYGISFILIFFSLSLASYIDRLIRFHRQGRRRLAPELYVALAVLLFGGFGLYRASISNGLEREPLFQAGVVQPYIPQQEKWDREKVFEIQEVIERQTRLAHAMGPDVILWPEAVTPFPLVGSPSMLGWVEWLSGEIEVPLLLGSLAVENSNTEAEIWRNAAFFVDPEKGVDPNYYSKRKLVPFGEYIPLHRLWPWLNRVIPVGGSFQPGSTPDPLRINVAGRSHEAGILICYEDVFPALGRKTVEAGADFLVVVTNNAWYGEGGAAYQHAVHSVLRAVETRRPVLRAGNGGWSGWIDEYGNIRNVLVDEDESIYFRGAGILSVSRDIHWAGRKSFYVRFGDWFVAVSALLFLAACPRTRKSRPGHGTAEEKNCLFGIAQKNK